MNGFSDAYKGENLASGSIYDEILQEFPDLSPEHIAACLDYARDES